MLSLSLCLRSKFWLARPGGGESASTASVRIYGADTSDIEDGLRIEWSPSGAATWTTLGTLGPFLTPIDPETGLGEEYDETFDGLPFNTLVDVRGVNVNGAGDSEAFSFTMYTRPEYPVTGLAALPNGATEINLTWDTPAEEPLSGYRIYFRTGTDPYAEAGVVGAGSHSTSITGLAGGISYDTYAVAYNSNDEPISDAETEASTVVACSTAAETDPPTIINVEISADGLVTTITLSEPIHIGAGGSGGWAMTASGGAVTQTYDTFVFGSQILLNNSRVIGGSETVTQAYTQPGNGVEDLSGNDMVTVSGVAVTNGSLVDTDSSNYFTAGTATGATLSSTYRDAVTAFIVGCKADASPNSGVSNWDAMKECLILAGWSNLTGALVPLKGSAPTNSGFTNAADYTPTGGLSNSGADQYLTSARANNADPQNNHSMGVYTTAGTTNNSTRFIGSTPSGNATEIVTGATSTTPRVNPRFRSQTATLSTLTVANGTGMIGLSRHQSGSYIARAWGTQATISVASGTPKTGQVGIFASADGTSKSTMTFKFYWIGEAVDLSLLGPRLTTLFAVLN